MNVDALLSFLNCVPGLTEVDIHSGVSHRYLDFQDSVLPSNQSKDFSHKVRENNVYCISQFRADLHFDFFGV